MKIFIEFLKTTGIGQPKSAGKSSRAENRKRWQEEKDKKEKSHKGNLGHHHHHDDHCDPDDWTY
jgi:hypothetical protein